MKTRIEKWIVRYGKQICSFAVAIAAITPLCCRGYWYQPKEPDNLDSLLMKR